MYDPHATNPADLLDDCSECGSDGWVWDRPGGLGTPYVEVRCPACGGSGTALKDDNERRRKNREPDHDPAEDRLPDESREP